jgi:hypothetical protein
MVHYVRLVHIGERNKQLLVNSGERYKSVRGGIDFKCDNGNCDRLYCIHPSMELPPICERCAGIFLY